MRFTIIGVRYTSFTAQSGQTISGQTIWFTEPISPSTGRGVKADKAFLPDSKIISPEMLPCDAEIYYNKYGKVDSIRIL